MGKKKAKLYVFTAAATLLLAVTSAGRRSLAARSDGCAFGMPAAATVVAPPDALRRHVATSCLATARFGSRVEASRAKVFGRAAVLSPPPAPLGLHWWGGHGMALLIYVINWLVLGAVMPRGVPEREIIDKVNTPRLFVAFVVGALLELLVVYVLPWPAMAIHGNWRLGCTLFAPCMIMTAINIFLEGLFRRKKLITTVYSNTGASGLWRLLSYCAVFTYLRGMPLPYFRAVSALGIVLHIGFIIVFTPAIAAGLPLKREDSRVLTGKDMLPGSAAD